MDSEHSYNYLENIADNKQKFQCRALNFKHNIYHKILLNIVEHEVWFTFDIKCLPQLLIAWDTLVIILAKKNAFSTTANQQLSNNLTDIFSSVYLNL